jgi:hypothetical protein
MVETLSIIPAAAMAISTGALLLLHALPTGYNPIRDAVSDYAIGRYRSLFWTFTTAGAISGLTLAIALARSHPPKPTLTVAMLLLSAAARVLIPVFPTDQSGSRFQTPKGTIHMVLAVAIFASIAVAASNLGNTLGHESAWQSVKGLVDSWLPGSSPQPQPRPGSRSSAPGSGASSGSSSVPTTCPRSPGSSSSDRARTDRQVTPARPTPILAAR